MRTSIIALLFISTHIYAAYTPQTEISGTVRVNIVSGSVAVDTTGLATSAGQSSQTTVLNNSYNILSSIWENIGNPAPTSAILIGAKDISNSDVLSPLSVDGSGYLQTSDPNANASLSSIDSTGAKDSSLTTLNTTLNTLLKPSSTLTAVTTVGTITNPVTVNSHAVTNAGTFATQVTSGTVNLGAGSNAIGSITNTSFTANAGTNLNTSLLALESGGNLASIKTNTDNLGLSLGSTTSGQKGNLILGAVTTSDPSYTTAQTNALSLLPNGYLRVSAVASGTTAVTVASLPLPSTAATSTKQSDGTQKTQIVDGSGNVIASTSNALNINISSGSIANTSFTATQSTATSLKTQAENYQGGSAVSISNPLFTTMSSETTKVIGQVTANAGTNLNTSLLALESGGNLATIKTDVDNLNLAQGSTTSGQKGNLVLGATTTQAPTYTTAQSNPISLDTLGNVRVVATPSGTTTVSVSNIPHVIADSGSTTAVTQATGTNLHTVVDSGAVTVTNATATNLKAQAELYQGGTAVGNANPIYVSLAGVSTSGFVSVSQTNILPNFTTTATVSAPNAANTSFVFKVSNTNRKGLQAMNTTDVNCWLAYGSSVTSTTSTVYLLAGTGYFNMPYPIYTGQIQGICSGNPTTGALTGTEQ